MNTEILLLQKNANDSVLSNETVLFDEISLSQGNIQYDENTGIITIQASGIYVIDWNLSTQSTSGSTGVMFQLQASTGQEFESNSPVRMGNLTGIAALQVDTVPVELTLVNKSLATVFFPSTLGVKATLRIACIDQADLACLPLLQFAHVLDQLVVKYPEASVSVFSNRLATITSNLDGLYRAPSAQVPLLLLNGGEPYAFAINYITALYFPNQVYDETITYLPLPEGAASSCQFDASLNIYEMVSVGDTIQMLMGPTTSGSGTVTVNAPGIIVIADDTSMMFVFTPSIFGIQVSAAGFRQRAPLRIEAI